MKADHFPSSTDCAPVIKAQVAAGPAARAHC